MSASMPAQHARARVAAILIHVAVAFFALATGIVYAAPLPPTPGASDSGAGTSGDAVKAAPVVLPTNLSREMVRDIVSRLSDQEVRALLLQQLDKVTPPQPATGEPSRPDVSADLLSQLDRSLDATIEALPRLTSLGPFVLKRLTEGGRADAGWRLLGALAAVLAAGVVGEGLLRALVPANRMLASESLENWTIRKKSAVLAFAFFKEMLALAAFFVCSLLVFLSFFATRDPPALAVAAVVGGILATRAAMAVLRLILAPSKPTLRLPPLDDATAKTIYRQLIIVAVTMAGTNIGLRFLGDVGVGADMLTAVSCIFIVVFFIVLTVLCWLDRRLIGRQFLSADAGEDAATRAIRRFLADHWHILAIAFLLVIAVLAVAHKLVFGHHVVGPIVASLSVFFGLPIVDWLVRATVTNWLDLATVTRAGPHVSAPGDNHPDDLAGAEEAQRDLAKRIDYRNIIVRNVRIVLVFLAMIVVAHIWNVDVQSMAAQGVGRSVADALFDIAVTVIIASAIFSIVRTTIRHSVPQDVEGAVTAGEPAGTGGTRAQTLVPLLGKFLLVAVVVIAGMIVLSQLGVDIGPLIAGAGIAGIAVGFGAQTLVRDILSGAFFLAEDAFRIGEYIDTGTVKGTVERISIRSLRLRHHRGALNTVPFGEIRHLANYSRDWAIMKLEVRVPFDTDLEKVRRLVKKVGQEMLQHPEYGASFVQPLKSQGVDRIDDSGFIVRVKFMSKPNEQWVLRREVFRRLQEIFTENGIKFAHRRVIVDSEVPSSAAAAATGAGEPVPGGAAGRAVP